MPEATSDWDPSDLPATDAARASLADDPHLAAALRRRLEHGDARPREALLSFRDADAYREFLQRAARSGLRVIRSNDKLLTVQVGYDAIDAIQRDLVGHAPGYADLGPNRLVHVPSPPPIEEREARSHTPVGNRLLTTLGVQADNGLWGIGTTIAILDSGVATDTTFGNRLRYVDIGLGLHAGSGQKSGHGTAVAAVAAGQAADARGIAPAANLLSIRVTDGTDQSDIYTLSQAITAAVDHGAQVINISLGSYGTSLVLDRAIDYAVQHGVAIVAAAGNDQAARLAWPAADTRVISVGAVDANEQQALFSNSGPQLKLTAPGYGVQTAWLDQQRITMSGTSVSAPVVSGAIAALMSQDRSLNAAAAADVLRQHANDAGRAGNDPAYGNGVLNLGWALARNDAGRVDTAVSGFSFHEDSAAVQFVVQNRSTRGVASLKLIVETNGAASTHAIDWLQPGGVMTVRVPITAENLAATGRVDFQARLENPWGLTDQVPANNAKAGSIAVRP